ncbi:MAG TPA: hypothetical protein VLA27_01370 [Paracoccaceae bacterium]|nr:hypothetical protein [Paracoccaceae bacterium]
MHNPFDGRTVPLSGPATDYLPVTPSDTTDLSDVAIGLYVETGGTLSVVTLAGTIRSITVPNNFTLPLAVTRVRATGTTATGIHAGILA